MLGPECYQQAAQGRNFTSMAAPYAAFAADIDAALAQLRQWSAPDVAASSMEHPLLACHRNLDDVHVYLLYNPCETENHDGRNPPRQRPSGTAGPRDRRIRR